MTTALMMCTEPGRLEAESILLARSLRRYAGNLDDTVIVCAHPRESGALEPKTLKQLFDLDVVYLRVPLNRHFENYPIANKALVAAWAEEHLRCSTVVMLDSDKIVFNPLAELSLHPEQPIALRPVHQKLCGTTGNDENAATWENLYGHWSLKPRYLVQTTMHAESIRGYWNSGLVAARTEVGLFSAWRNRLLQLLERPLLTGAARYFADQFALAAAVDELDAEVKILPSSYNYPIAFQEAVGPTYRLERLEQMVTVHYHKMFYGIRAEHPLAMAKVPLDTERAQWLTQALEETGVWSSSALARGQRLARRGVRQLRRSIRR